MGEPGPDMCLSNMAPKYCCTCGTKYNKGKATFCSGCCHCVESEATLETDQKGRRDLFRKKVKKTNNNNNNNRKQTEPAEPVRDRGKKSQRLRKVI